MCGLIGFAGKLPAIINSPDKRKQVMEMLLILDSTRGTDGAGVYSCNVAKDTIYREILTKSVGNPFNLIESRQWEKHMFGGDIMMAHNRATSTGINSNDNAHPHQFGDVVGAHNGTLSGWYTHPEYKNYNLDSQFILDSINKNGVDKTINKLTGSWSLTWINTKDATINFLRNKERPMNIIAFKEGGIMWASEMWMLNAVADKYNLQFKKAPIDIDTWYSFFLNDDGKVVLLGEEKVEGKSYSSSNWEYKSKYTHRSYPTPVSTDKKEVPDVKESKKYACCYCGEVKSAKDIADRYNAYGGIWVYTCKDCANEFNMMY